MCYVQYWFGNSGPFIFTLLCSYSSIIFLPNQWPIESAVILFCQKDSKAWYRFFPQIFLTFFMVSNYFWVAIITQFNGSVKNKEAKVLSAHIFSVLWGIWLGWNATFSRAHPFCVVYGCFRWVSVANLQNILWPWYTLELLRFLVYLLLFGILWSQWGLNLLPPANYSSTSLFLGVWVIFFSF